MEKNMEIKWALELYEALDGYLPALWSCKTLVFTQYTSNIGQYEMGHA